MKIETVGSVFDEFMEVMDKLRNGDKESAMIVLERKPWKENKHAMIGDFANQITLFEWGISAIAESTNVSFEELIELINAKHKETKHTYLSNHAERFGEDND